MDWISILLNRLFHFCLYVSNSIVSNSLLHQKKEPLSQYITQLLCLRDRNLKAKKKSSVDGDPASFKCIFWSIAHVNSTTKFFWLSLRNSYIKSNNLKHRWIFYSIFWLRNRWRFQVLRIKFFTCITLWKDWSYSFSPIKNLIFSLLKFRIWRPAWQYLRLKYKMNCLTTSWFYGKNTGVRKPFLPCLEKKVLYLRALYLPHILKYKVFSAYHNL